MMGRDERDADTIPMSSPAIAQAAHERPPMTPRLAFARTAIWDQADEECREAFAELADALSGTVTDLDLGPTFAEAHDLLRLICDVETAANLAKEYDVGRDDLSRSVVDIMERGRGIGAFEYVRARTRVGDLRLVLDEVFGEFDAIVTPSADGAAPLRSEGTGSPGFAMPWSLMGVPSLNLPLLANDKGLPIGVQLVGARLHDSRLMRTARWLLDELAGDKGDER
jgi:Asp-tRNA(Asn)/Glu-tRNA(Gln) amidotransferase A subunit family amidase